MIKEYERELNELQEGKLISKEDLHEGDEIIYNGEHYFVTLTDTGTDFVWITDDESERYNRNAQGWTVKVDWIDEVIGQPEEDELDESLKEDLSTRKERYKKFNRILALRAADTDEQKEAIKAIKSTLDSLGIKAHYGTSSGQPKTVIFDVGKHYNAIYVHADGTVLIGDEEEGKVDPSNKEEVKQMLIDHGFIGNGINEGWKDFAFIVKCNDGPKELVRVVAEDKSEAEKYAKDMYAANHTIYADDRYNVWSIEDKNRSLKEDRVTGKPEDADEKIQFGDEIVYNGKHLFVINANFMDSDRYLWVTDKREDRYNRWAPGKLLAKDLVDKVIRQPDEDGQEDKMNKSIDFTNAADVRHRLDSYSGQYLTITFRGSHDWKYISDLLDEYNDGDEEEADLALDKLEAIYGSEYKLLKALEVDEISEITVYDSDVSVTIKVDKDNLYHNYADLINNPSIKKDTVKILELELNESLKKRYKKSPLKESTPKEKTIKEDLAVNGEETLVDTANKPAVKPAVIIIKVESSISADGFEVTVKGTDGSIIDQHSFRYGYNAAYSRLGVDKYRPFVTDIINRYLSKYNLNKDNIIVTKGRNVFKGTDVSDEDIADFKTDYLGSHLDESKNGSLKENYGKRYKKSPVMEDLDFTDEAEIRKQLAKYSGQYLTITFKGSEDWKHISDLLDESINSDEEEEEELALDKLEASYGREYDLLKSLEVEEISEIVAYTSYVIVTIRVEKDNLQHNFSDHYADLINMPSIDTGTIKILELDKPTVQSINTSSMTRDEMVDFIDDYIGDTSNDEYEKFKDEIALNFGLVWDNLKEDPKEWVYPSFTDNGLRTIIDKIIKAAKPAAGSAH